MSKILIVGDIHISEDSVKEINEIFEKDILPIKADTMIQLGDWFDKNTPTPIELKFSAELVLKLKKHYKKIIILSGTGSHDFLRGESVISHLASLGVKTIKGDYIDNNILFGHWMLHESMLAFGSGKYSIKDLSKYTYCFAGHQHLKEFIKPNFYHIGSIRATSFNEVGDSKQIAILEDNKLSFIPLKHCIPMIDVYKIEDLEKIDARTKVRFVCKSFEQYRTNASLLNRLGKKFVQFKIKLDFNDEITKDLTISKTETIKTINKDEIIQDYIEKIEDKEVKELLKEVINETK